jgi:hypothetical protein
MKNKKNKIIVVIGIVLLIILAVVFLHKEQPVTPVEKAIEKAIVDKPTHSVKKPKKQEVTEEFKKPDNVTEEFWNRMLEVHRRAKAMNGPISFYGKIIDQNNDPVSGMKISWSITRKNESFKEYFGGGKQNIKTTHELFSDHNGEFAIPDKYGYSIRVYGFEKNGYKSKGGMGGNSTFGYQQYSKENPKTFKVWKELEKTTEPLIKNKNGYNIICDSRKYYINLITGKKTDNPAEADIAISYDVEKGLIPFTWSADVEFLNGGVIKTNDFYTYLAPEEGYDQNKLEYQYTKDQVKDGSSTGWRSGVREKFYTRLRNGKLYGIVIIDISVGRTGTGDIFIDRILNPSGSRNLQYDPKKKIHKKEYSRIDKELR